MMQNQHHELSAVKHNINLEPNNNTLKCVLTPATDFGVDFTTANSSRTVLGFSAQVCKSGYHESENIGNVNNLGFLFVLLWLSKFYNAEYDSGLSV